MKGRLFLLVVLSHLVCILFGFNVANDSLGIAAAVVSFAAMAISLTIVYATSTYLSPTIENKMVEEFINRQFRKLR